MQRLGLVLLMTPFLLLAACGNDEPPAEPEQPAWPSEEERTMEEGMAPTPFTAQQIRDGCWAGRTVTWRVEREDMDPFLNTFHFIGGDPQVCEFQITARDEEGKVLNAGEIQTASWEALQSHASYPLENTTIEDVTLETATGTHDCFLYTVKQEKDGIGGKVEMLTRYWFSKSHPGPPLQIETEIGGDVIARHILVSDEETAGDK